MHGRFDRLRWCLGRLINFKSAPSGLLDLAVDIGKRDSRGISLLTIRPPFHICLQRIYGAFCGMSLGQKRRYGNGIEGSSKTAGQLGDGSRPQRLRTLGLILQASISVFTLDLTNIMVVASVDAILGTCRSKGRHLRW